MCSMRKVSGHNWDAELPAKAVCSPFHSFLWDMDTPSSLCDASSQTFSIFTIRHNLNTSTSQHVVHSSVSVDAILTIPSNCTGAPHLLVFHSLPLKRLFNFLFCNSIPIKPPFLDEFYLSETFKKIEYYSG